jgi:chitin synthase
LTQYAFHKFEDHLRATDTEEQKRNRLRNMEAEAGLNAGTSDPFAPYSMSTDNITPMAANYADPFGQSNQQLPLVANAAPFQRADLYEDFDERKSFRSEEYDGASRYTSHRDDTVSQFGSESYAPSRNMFYSSDKKALLEKEALPGEIMEGETVEEMKETANRRRWLVLVWLLTWWLPGPFLRWIGRMKRVDVRQAWREKFAINIIIWIICASAVFVIAVLGRLICPREFVFSSGELQSHGPTDGVVYTAIRGEVFDLSEFVSTHSRAVSVVPQKSVLKYGGLDATPIFPVQVSAIHLLLTES